MKHRESLADRAREAITRRWKPAGAGCLDDNRLLDFYCCALDEEEDAEVREHLVGCSRCRERARQARTFVNVICEPVDEASMSHAGFSWRQLHVASSMLAAAAMVVLGLGTVLLFWRTHRAVAPPVQQVRSVTLPSATSEPPAPNPWRDLTVAKAEYSPPVAGPDEMYYRDGTEVPKSGNTLPLAMEPYERDDFGEAERRLAKFLVRNPKASEAHFYRGVSLLVLGRTPDAIAPLQAAIATGKGAVVEEARWYLALALLKNGRPAQALEQLDALSSTPGAHRTEAQHLASEVRAKTEESR